MLRQAVLLGCLCLCTFPTFARGEEIVLNAVGDIMLAGSGTPTYARLGYDYPFAATRHHLQRGDLAIGNLEAPLTSRGREFRDKRFRFRADPAAATALREAGFTVLTLANNHMLDYGYEGLRDTADLLDRHGILHAGAGDTLEAARRAATITVKGKRLAFLAYSLTLPQEFYATDRRPGTAPGYSPFFADDIAKARQTADYVIVSFHWGTEGAERPHSRQVAAARRAIDAGADVVLGHHPHVLQGIERYKDGVILYSLGNFAFGSLSPSSRQSVIARITLEEGVRGVEFIPLNVQNSTVLFQPRVLESGRGDAVIAHLNRISAQLGTAIVTSDGRHLLDMEGDNQQVAAR
ncbi:CapA family protein [Geomobilimonas luticola]|uniref:CapA family protein n=1 Tax=Geomobilimonas luticola TaxID=1114878 RepID=A0ABS5S990_9BACT|nr:CapA family protein [Geomobilimonas luticola]MBT0651938.1 CapA family protein [Geomobilimonas luticola]